MTVSVCWWVMGPLVASMVTVYVPGVVELTARVEVAGPSIVKVTAAGLKVTVGPDGETLAERVTPPAKPLRLLTVMLDAAVWPAIMTRVFRLVVMIKSGAGVTVTVMVTKWASVPLMPVTVMV